MALADDRVYDLHAAVCKAIAHPVRMKVLDLLRDGEECVCRLAPQVGVTESNLSQLLAVLRNVGIVETRREGHSIYYRVRDPRIFEVIDRMREILADQLARADSLAMTLQA
ncbi:MAG: helix-turn-helix transcriptional regulator [Armatimonadota bacterium]|nr:MAG: helix-turn-helix transcriptional regulator [Armatimonadota bacterium]